MKNEPDIKILDELIETLSSRTRIVGDPVGLAAISKEIRETLELRRKYQGSDR